MSGFIFLVINLKHDFRSGYNAFGLKETRLQSVQKWITLSNGSL